MLEENVHESKQIRNLQKNNKNITLLGMALQTFPRLEMLTTQ